MEGILKAFKKAFTKNGKIESFTLAERLEYYGKRFRVTRNLSKFLGWKAGTTLAALIFVAIVIILDIWGPKLMEAIILIAYPSLKTIELIEMEGRIKKKSSSK